MKVNNSQTGFNIASNVFVILTILTNQCVLY